MALKKDKRSGGVESGGIGEESGAVVIAAPSPVRMGRPKQNPHAEDKKLTIRVPVDVHRRLRYASVDLDKPMVEIAVDALIAYLTNHEA